MNDELENTDATDAPREVISVRDLSVALEGELVLDEVNLTVNELDFIGLIGPNGGGKTTLLRTLLGLITPTWGEVSVMGGSVKAGRRYISYVPQAVEFDRDFPVKVWEVALMGRLSHRGLLRRYTASDRAVVADALGKVGMLELEDRPLGELSGGQRQRVYIARALATEPKIMLLDEPMANVDPQTSSNIYELLGQLNERITILMISHDLAAISSYVKTVGCLNRRLFYHGGRQITPEMLEAGYQCPVDLIAHEVPHRHLGEHGEVD